MNEYKKGLFWCIVSYCAALLETCEGDLLFCCLLLLLLKTLQRIYIEITTNVDFVVVKIVEDRMLNLFKKAVIGRDHSTNCKY